MEQKKKKRVTAVFIGLIFLAGLSLLLYPAVADLLNYIDAHKVIGEYEEYVRTQDDDVSGDLLSAAQDYNAALAANTPYLSMLTNEKRKLYNSILDPTGSGIMGYIDIPKINVLLPVYHGTDDNVMSMGVGHFDGSSFPVGGESVHTVLTSHNGLPTAKLFTDLYKLEIGDVFSIHVLGRTLFYEVDHIEVVEPEALYGMHIDEGMDYCSLVTCTPYGVNTHRLVVRGCRVEPGKESQLIEEASVRIRKNGWHIELFYVPFAVVLTLIVIVLTLRIIRRKR